MINIYYFTGTGHSLKLAKHLGRLLNEPIRNISCDVCKGENSDTAVVVFPVYCQNIPKPVKQFLKELYAGYVVLIAVYGRFSFGNVLWEAERLVQGTVIAAAYIPAGHSYLEEPEVSFEEDRLLPVLERIKEPCKAVIPKSFKNPLANIFPALRSRIGVKIRRTVSCRECGLCNNICPMQTMNNGIIGRKCIRCLRCVVNCPQNALEVTYNSFLKLYLRGKRKDEFIIYL